MNDDIINTPSRHPFNRRPSIRSILNSILQPAPSVARSGEVQVNSAPGAPRGRKRKARDEDAEVAGEGGSAPLSAPSSRQMVLRTRKGNGKARDEDTGAAEEGSPAPQWVPSPPEPGQEQFERIPARLKGKGKARDEATGAAAGSSSAATTSAPLPQGQHKVQDKAKRDKNAENASNQREVLRKEHVELNEQLPDEYQDKRYPTAPLLGATRGAIRYISALEKQLETERNRHQEEANLLTDHIRAYMLRLEGTVNERDTLRSEREGMVQELAQLKRKVDDAKCSDCDSALTSAT
ncbi:hypothetical protein EWM64_g2400 [Hericium alpestre]|uniref:Uncharacterized protein n=1 Tax=Hericium alpestre TaxID=135208 RepID=A0A4Z0A3L2_9AGAM|nr:hypothetical protein EWM64_g2400 [Hericium alpestre]